MDERTAYTIAAAARERGIKFEHRKDYIGRGMSKSTHGLVFSSSAAFALALLDVGFELGQKGDTEGFDYVVDDIDRLRIDNMGKAYIFY